VTVERCYVRRVRAPTLSLGFSLLISVLAGCAAEEPAKAPVQPSPVAVSPGPASPKVVAEPVTVREDLGEIFTRHGVDGAFAMLDGRTGSWALYQPERCATRFVPASTFKIANALIGLETGVLADEKVVFPYDRAAEAFRLKGATMDVPEWRRDHDLASGMKFSVVWYYQELARRIGKERMDSWVKKLGYGNMDTGTVVDRFWLDGPLAISPREQLGFLKRLHDGTLPLSARSMEIVRKIIEIEKTDAYTLRGKTGLADANGGHGWLVGWVERGEDVHYFATILLANGRKLEELIPLRHKVAREALAKLGTLPASKG
jgi:beta-lactamase class D